MKEITDEEFAEFERLKSVELNILNRIYNLNVRLYYLKIDKESSNNKDEFYFNARIIDTLDSEILQLKELLK